MVTIVSDIILGLIIVGIGLVFLFGAFVAFGILASIVALCSALVRALTGK